MTNPLEPLERRVRQRTALERQLVDTKTRRRQVEAEMVAYRQFDMDEATSKISSLHYELDAKRQSVSRLTEQHQSITRDLATMESQASSPLMVIRYFSKPQVELRKRIAEIKDRASRVHLEIERGESERRSISEAVDSVLKDVSRFSKFDLDGAIASVSEYQRSEGKITADIGRLASEIADIEAKAGAHIKEYERLQREVRQLNVRIAQAEQFDQSLSSASNGYERAKIHEECERQFGDGSPKKILRDAKAQLRTLNNNIPKLEQRIKSTIAKSEMTVRHLIIDGNNACYDGGQFIQLRAVSALVKWVRNSFKTTIVFDASIRRNLRADDADIRRYLGSSASVYVAPTKTAADEYILKLAGADPHTYVLSNDRYAEFHDYDAVAAGRVLRFLIADGRIMVNDLDLSAPI